jgi:hypothetical protein
MAPPRPGSRDQRVADLVLEHERARHFGELLRDDDRQAGLHAGRHRDGAADLHGDGAGDVGLSRLEPGGEAVEPVGPFAGCGVAPVRVAGPARRPHGAIDVVGGASRHAADHVFGRGRSHVDGAGRGRALPAPSM